MQGRVALFILVALGAFPTAAAAQRSADRSAAAFDPVAAPLPPRSANTVRPAAYEAFRVDRPALAAVLDDGPGVVVSLPDPGGVAQRFRVREASVLAPELQAQRPDVRTYAGRGVDDPAATLSVTVTPDGVHASVRSPGGGWYLDPVGRSVHVAYARSALPRSAADPDVVEGETTPPAELPSLARGGEPVTRRTYRLALLNDPSYAADVGDVTAAKAVLVSRVDQIYADDLGIRFQLVGTDAQLNLDTTAKATAAGLSSSARCTGTTLDAFTPIVGRRLAGTTGYDVGHLLLGTGSGGIATLGVVGGAARASGCTSREAPVGDPFVVDYVAHELGHQFGAQHTFAGSAGSCAGNGRGATADEPGSGSTIMGYAGICGADDLQSNSDPYFSWRSIADVRAYVTTAQSALQEQQRVDLTSYDTGDEFRLTDGTRTTAAIVRGTNYTAADIRTAMAAASLGTVDVTAVTATGFTVTWTARTAQPLLGLSGATPGTTASVGEIVPGGPATNGGATAATGNTAPIVTAPPDSVIPVRTPFVLAGTGTDPDGDPLRFSWEQADAASGQPLLSDAKTRGPLFRVFAAAGPGNVPGTDPVRTFPDLAQILAGNTDAASGACPAGDVECFSEFLPTELYAGGPLDFRLTARDSRPGGGGTAFDDTRLVLDRTAGPFRVTAPAEPVTVGAGGTLDAGWDVANTTNATTNAQAVRISLSLDGGLTYPVQLAPSTPNDGAETVTIPRDVPETADARIRIDAVDGVFFDVSRVPVTVGPPVPLPDPAPAPAAATTATAAVPSAAASPVARLRPRLLGRSRLTVRRGRVAVPLRCVAAGTGTLPARCAGVVTLVVGRRTVGTARFAGRTGRTLTVRVRLTRAGRRQAARRGGARVRLRVRLRPTGRAANRLVRVTAARR